MKFEIAPKSTEIRLNWHEAILYCQFLECDGFGWRLPTKYESNKIYNSNKRDFEIDWYWTSNECNGLKAWGQNYDNGNRNYYGNYKNNSYYVRAVRSII